ncbi:MAG: hypothetical protein FWD82_00610 [Defluviitaleaceae bacterium]|nr:hypothetical protein [Defluviitaleaceae bacterium]
MDTLINQVMTWIWKPISQIYDDAYEEARNLKAIEIYNGLAEVEAGFYKYPSVNLNILPSSGCSHRIKNNIMSGCSMCNYQSDFAKSEGYMKALREKDANLYTDVIIRAFKKARTDNLIPNKKEMLSTYDGFDSFEMPNELIDKLWDVNSFFKEQPFGVVVQVRAESVTEEKLDKLINTLPKRTRITVEFGVECSNEFVRNNWLNKNTFNRQIEEAIRLVRKKGLTVQCNMLIGMPGLTEEVSKKLAVETIFYLDDLKVDKIVVLPLNRKKYTLQWFIYEHLKDNKNLKELGIAQEEHTGIPWLYTVYETIYQVYLSRPYLMPKLLISQMSESNNMIDNDICYNKDSKCICNGEVKDIILNHKSAEELLMFKDKVYNDSCSCADSYFKLLKLQEKAGDAKNVAYIIMDEIKKEMMALGYTEKFIDMSR